ncbi:trypsin-like peptidase domain-containing protein [Halobacteriaceae archaeon GCM10025711]
MDESGVWTETDRRTALKLFGAGAVTLGAGGVLGSALLSDGSVEITTVKRGDDPVVTESVPAAWYDHERQARSVRDRLRSQYADVDGVKELSLGDAGERIEGRQTSSVDIYVDPEAGVDADLPSRVDGVLSRVRDWVPPELLRCEVDGDQPLAGNVPLTNGRGKWATATGAVRRDGRRYLLTCAHLFGGSKQGCDSLTGMGVFGPDEGYVGHVADFDPGQDWALVDGRYAGVSLDPTVAGEAGVLAGRVTRDGLADLKSRETTVYKMGYRSGFQQGTVKAVDLHHGGCDVTDGRSGERYVDVDVPSKHGDSGGPVYHRYERDGDQFLALVGVTSALVGYTRVSTAAAIYDEHGIRFDPDVSTV